MTVFVSLCILTATLAWLRVTPVWGSAAQQRGAFGLSSCEFGNLQKMWAVGSKLKTDKKETYSLDPQRSNKSSEFSTILYPLLCTMNTTSFNPTVKALSPGWLGGWGTCRAHYTLRTFWNMRQQMPGVRHSAWPGVRTWGQTWKSVLQKCPWLVKLLHLVALHLLLATLRICILRVWVPPVRNRWLTAADRSFHYLGKAATVQLLSQKIWGLVRFTSWQHELQ